VTAAVPLTLTADAHGATVTVTLANVSTAAVAVWFEVEGPNGPLYDCLSVDLTGPGDRRTLLLTGDRNASTSGRVVLDPDAALSATIDLADWALAPINGGDALAPGAWTATLWYRCDEPDCWRGEVVAAPVSVHVAD